MDDKTMSSETVGGNVLNVVAEEAGRMGVEIVDIAGNVDFVSNQVAQQVEIFNTMSENAKYVSAANQRVTEVANMTQENATNALNDLNQSKQFVNDALQDVGKLVTSVGSMENHLSGLQGALSQVADIANVINSIAKQTNLLALNATIEAARAGEAGRGFAVVAGEVKTLANQTADATADIENTIKELDSQARTLIEEGSAATELADNVQGGAKTIGTTIEEVEQSMSTIAGQSNDIVSSATEIDSSSQQFLNTLTEMSGEVNAASSSLEDARDRVNKLIDVSEHLIGETAASGAETIDTPYIKKVLEIAGGISRAFEQAIDDGKITEAELFDRDYQPIAGTNPEQLHVGCLKITDDVLPQFQEEALGFSDKVVFCASVDENGFLPTHNHKFSKPQGDDPVWNAANCRNRRLFNDRVGLKAGRNTEPFLLQTYRRDMGGGNFVMMKDLSAPITVKGRHWGGVRFAYSL